MNKKDVREHFRKLRLYHAKLFSNTERDVLYSNLNSILEFSSANTLMLYISKEAEVDTHKLFTDLLDLGKKIALPRVNTTTKKMDAYIVNSIDDLIPASFGIMEPKAECKLCSPSDVDVVLVPAIAFDEQCNRIGHGHGFYDKFLSSCNCTKIGICFDAQIAKFIPIDEHDQPMDYVVSEKRIIKRKK